VGFALCVADLDTGGVIQPVDDASLSSLGGVSGTARTADTAEQDPSTGVADDQGFHHVLTGCAGDEFACVPPRLRAGRRTRISVASIGPVGFV
jgi:hypothetical protein